MIAQKRSLKKIVMATVVAMAVVLVSLFSLNAQDNPVTTDEEAGVVVTGQGIWVKTNCVCSPSGRIVGNSNDCNPGNANCNDNDCSGSSCA